MKIAFGAGLALISGCSLLVGNLEDSPQTLPDGGLPADTGTAFDAARDAANEATDATDATEAAADPSAYDKEVLALAPVLYVSCAGGSGACVDLSSNAIFVGTVGAPLGKDELPNQEFAPKFNGVDQALEVADHDALSIATTGKLTIESWIKPAALEFPKTEGTGYVHWAGKGDTGQQEYALRLYALTTTDSPPRPNRISSYAFNLVGGSGSGSYFQDALDTIRWIHVVAVFNVADTSVEYPTGYVRIYKNGILRDTTAMNQFGVVPANGTAPFRIGTRDGNSRFYGALGKLAIYSRELTAVQIASHYATMCRSGC